MSNPAFPKIVAVLGADHKIHAQAEKAHEQLGRQLIPGVRIVGVDVDVFRDKFAKLLDVVMSEVIGPAPFLHEIDCGIMRGPTGPVAYMAYTPNRADYDKVRQETGEARKRGIQFVPLGASAPVKLPKDPKKTTNHGAALISLNVGDDDVVFMPYPPAGMGIGPKRSGAGPASRVFVDE